MTKCPNCGSTAQVKLLGDYQYTDTIYMKKYGCDCGATIIEHFERKKILVYPKQGTNFNATNCPTSCQMEMKGSHPYD